MFSQACLEAVLVLNVLAAPAPMQPVLRWKLKEGDVIYHESVASTRQTMMVMGTKVDQDQEQTTVTRYTVKRKNADGGMVLEKTLVSLKGKGAVADAGLFNKIKGATFLVTLNARGEVVALEGYKQFLAGLGADETSRSLVSMMFTEETIKQSVNEVFGCLAVKGVSVGETWRRPYLQPMGPMGDFSGEMTYRYSGKTPVGGKNLDRITFTATMRYAPPRGQVGGGLPFRIDKADFSADELKGTIQFDPVLGRLVESSSSGRLKGKMTINVGEQATEIEMAQTVQMKSRLLDKAP
jgi:hypothetical protein